MTSPAPADRIISPEAPLALRLSGQLMLGVVRIYYKQVVYLEGDAQGALVNLNKVDMMDGIRTVSRNKKGRVNALSCRKGFALS